MSCIVFSALSLFFNRCGPLCWGRISHGRWQKQSMLAKRAFHSAQLCGRHAIIGAKCSVSLLCFLPLFVRFVCSFLSFFPYFDCLSSGQEYRQAIWPRIEKLLGHKLSVGKPRAALGAHHNGDPTYLQTSLPLGERVAHYFPTPTLLKHTSLEWGAHANVVCVYYTDYILLRNLSHSRWWALGKYWSTDGVLGAWSWGKAAWDARWSLCSLQTWNLLLARIDPEKRLWRSCGCILKRNPWYKVPMVPCSMAWFVSWMK